MLYIYMYTYFQQYCSTEDVVYLREGEIVEVRRSGFKAGVWWSGFWSRDYFDLWFAQLYLYNPRWKLCNNVIYIYSYHHFKPIFDDFWIYHRIKPIWELGTPINQQDKGFEDCSFWSHLGIWQVHDIQKVVSKLGKNTISPRPDDVAAWVDRNLQIVALWSWNWMGMRERYVEVENPIVRLELSCGPKV